MAFQKNKKRKQTVESTNVDIKVVLKANSADASMKITVRNQ